MSALGANDKVVSVMEVAARRKLPEGKRDLKVAKIVGGNRHQNGYVEFFNNAGGFEPILYRVDLTHEEICEVANEAGKNL